MSTYPIRGTTYIGAIRSLREKWYLSGIVSSVYTSNFSGFLADVARSESTNLVTFDPDAKRNPIEGQPSSCSIAAMPSLPRISSMYISSGWLVSVMPWSLTKTTSTISVRFRAAKLSCKFFEKISTFSKVAYITCGQVVQWNTKTDHTFTRAEAGPAAWPAWSSEGSYPDHLYQGHTFS